MIGNVKLLKLGGAMKARQEVWGQREVPDGWLGQG